MTTLVNMWQMYLSLIITNCFLVAQNAKQKLKWNTKKRNGSKQMILFVYGRLRKKEKERHVINPLEVMH